MLFRDKKKKIKVTLIKGGKTRRLFFKAQRETRLLCAIHKMPNTLFCPKWVSAAFLFFNNHNSILVLVSSLWLRLSETPSHRLAHDILLGDSTQSKAKPVFLSLFSPNNQNPNSVTSSFSFYLTETPNSSPWWMFSSVQRVINLSYSTIGMFLVDFGWKTLIELRQKDD